MHYLLKRYLTGSLQAPNNQYDFFFKQSLEKTLGISHLPPSLPHQFQVNAPFLSLLRNSVLVDIARLTFLALCYISLYFSFYKVRLRETEWRSNLCILSISITFISGIIIFSSSLFWLPCFNNNESSSIFPLINRVNSFHTN